MYLVQSCVINDSDGIITELEKIVPVKSKFEKVVFIPYRGCSNCVAKAFDYLKENPIEKDLIVFINYSSEKEIKIRLNIYQVKVSNLIFINEASKIIEHGVSSYYPTILDFRNDNNEIVIADPSNLEVWKRYQ